MSHRSGLRHQAADALSRILTDGTDRNPPDDEIKSIRGGTQGTDDEGEKLLLAKVRIAEGMNEHGAVILCAVEWENPLLDFRMAYAESVDRMPIPLEEFLQT